MARYKVRITDRSMAYGMYYGLLATVPVTAVLVIMMWVATRW